MGIIVTLSMRLLEPPDLDVLFFELEKSNWRSGGASGKISYSISDDDLSEESVVDIGRRAYIIREIATRSERRKQSMITIDHSLLGSISLAYFAREEAFVVEAIYSCDIGERDRRVDLNDAAEMILPSMEKACDWMASYSISVDR